MSSSSPAGDRTVPTVSDALALVRERIRHAAERAGREASEIQLVAVTKTVPAARVAEAVRCGVTTLGENRVQEAAAKEPLVAGAGVACAWHLIGTLQTNKARKAVDLFEMIQSVDRPRLAATLDRICGETGKQQRCLIEVKVSDEPAKSGVSLADADDFVRGFSQYTHLALEGLMTIAPFDVPLEGSRRAFRRLADLFAAHRDRFGPRPILSMGMTDDFEIAIEEGANMVRVGRALFGDRPGGVA